MEVAAPYRPRENDLDDEVRHRLDALVAEGRIDPVGADGPRLFAASHDEAGRAMRRFMDTRLTTFGDLAHVLAPRSRLHEAKRTAGPRSAAVVVARTVRDDVVEVGQARRRARTRSRTLLATAGERPENGQREPMHDRYSDAIIHSCQAGRPAPAIGGLRSTEGCRCRPAPSPGPVVESVRPDPRCRRSWRSGHVGLRRGSESVDAVESLRSSVGVPQFGQALSCAGFLDMGTDFLCDRQCSVVVVRRVGGVAEVDENAEFEAA